jgi:hypothetical protein
MTTVMDTAFLIDRGVGKSLEDAAIHRGHEVYSLIPELTPPVEIAAHAIDRGQILITSNARRYLPIYADVPAHPGLVITPNLTAHFRQDDLVRVFRDFMTWFNFPTQDVRNKLVTINQMGIPHARLWMRGQAVPPISAFIHEMRVSQRGGQ